jgi:hypothetical protein
MPSSPPLDQMLFSMMFWPKFPVRFLKGQSASVTALSAGPKISIAENVAIASAELGSDQGTLLKACPAGTTQSMIRVIWQGGITDDGVNEITDADRQKYQVTVKSKSTGATRIVIPFAIGDLFDGDNNQDLCLNTTDQAISVSVPAGTVVDPGKDPNPETTMDVKY